ncbi:hypothetical protein GCM10023086_77470 [Streptomyces venetus]|uniref:Uncharacterized protein n=1 Tax=Streptomyces venetus TaxID=1701086 RepID=A0ABP8HMG1_9ACTN
MNDLGLASRLALLRFLERVRERDPARTASGSPTNSAASPSSASAKSGARLRPSG